MLEEGHDVSEPITTRIARVETEFFFAGRRMSVSAYLVVRGGEAAIVDALMPGNVERFGQALDASASERRPARDRWAVVRPTLATSIRGTACY